MHLPLGIPLDLEEVEEMTTRRGPWRGYGAEDMMPLGGYTVLLAAWATAFGAISVRLGRARKLPAPGPADVALLGIATHKITRILTKDWVTAPLRAPFTRYEESSGSGEVSERSRGAGLRRAIGDLLTCNYCTGPWVAGALLAAWARSPHATRALASLFAVVAGSDFLHGAYENLRTRGRRLAAAAQVRADRAAELSAE